MGGPGEFELRSETVGALPVVNHFLDRIGLAPLLERHLPNDDRRRRVAPATVIDWWCATSWCPTGPSTRSGSGPPPTRPAWSGCPPPTPPQSTTTGWAHPGPSLRHRPGQPHHRDRPGCHPRLRPRLLPAAQRLDHGHLLGQLPRGYRRRERRQGDTRDHLRPQQGPQARPQTAAVDPDHLRRWGRAHRLPHRPWQHRRLDNPHRHLGPLPGHRRASRLPLLGPVPCYVQSGRGSACGTVITHRLTAHNQRVSRKARSRSPGRNRAGVGLGSVSRRKTASLAARSASRYPCVTAGLECPSHKAMWGGPVLVITAR